jgi:hypothetical protein
VLCIRRIFCAAIAAPLGRSFHPLTLFTLRSISVT